MDFFSRYELLCSEVGLKPQSAKMFDVAGVTSGAITCWKKGALPKGEVLCRLADFFGVTTDYLLGLTDIKEKAVPILTEQEQLILDIYRSVPAQSQFHIIQVCMNEKENFKKENTQAI